MFLETAEIIKHIHFIVQEAESFHLLILKAPQIARCAKPGQFLMVRIGNTFDPLLRRPFSVFFCEKEKIAILYKVVGKGTKLMTRWKEGDNVDILGPLGNSFDVSFDSVWLVAGGAGIVPIFFLASVLKGKKVSFEFIWGLRYKVHPDLLKFLKENINQLVIYTEDGSLGYQGLVTDGIKTLFKRQKPNFIYACGPLAMLKALSTWAKEEKIPMQVSLETNMACGVGACLGCVVATKDGYCKVCYDGPIFDANKIKWE